MFLWQTFCTKVLWQIFSTWFYGWCFNVYDLWHANWSCFRYVYLIKNLKRVQLFWYSFFWTECCALCCSKPLVGSCRIRTQHSAQIVFAENLFTDAYTEAYTMAYTNAYTDLYTDAYTDAYTEVHIDETKPTLITPCIPKRRIFIPRYTASIWESVCPSHVVV